MGKNPVKIIISAINFTDAGPLKILKECVESTNSFFNSDYEIYVLVHNRSLISNTNVNVIEFPKSKKSWILRIWYEWWYFKKLSDKIEPDLWLSLHDITSNVKAKNRVVYCHNPSPFYRLSFLPNEITCAFLYAQLQNLRIIQDLRINIWKRYQSNLMELINDSAINFIEIPNFATNNAHIFYFCTDCLNTRNELINFLKASGISATFHYSSLHKSAFFESSYSGPKLVHCDYYSDNIVRLPLFADLSHSDVDFISSKILDFYGIK